MTWSYRPALDGLRSVAVYLVLFFHAGLGSFSGGFIGVDLFFVLSGFLVSNVILAEIDKTGRLSLGRFYARRVRRLLPAAALVVVVTAGMFLLVAPVVRRLPLVVDAQASLLYVANWNFLLQQNDYFATDVDESPFLHYWSLAIEEQFYFVFPVVLLLLSKATRRWAGAMVAAVAGLMLLSLASQLYWAQADATWAYYGTDARLYQLLAGALLAVVMRQTMRRPSARTAATGAVVALVGLLALGSSLFDLTPSWRGIAATVAATALIGTLMSSETGRLGRLLSRPTPVYLGQISYGTYLWHWPVILLLEEFLAVQPLTLAVLATGLSTALAAGSFQLFEMPIRSAPVLRPFGWSTAIVGVAMSALIAVTVVPQVLESERRPRLAEGIAGTALPDAPVGEGASTEARNAPIPGDIDWASFLGGTGEYPQCTTDDLDACILVEGDGPHIALIGDSHAKMLTPMFETLAEEKGFTLSVNAIPACPWQSGVVNLRQSQARTDKCNAAREPWYDEVLPQLDPDVVILSSLPRATPRWQGLFVGPEGPDHPINDTLRSATRRTLEQITPHTERVLMLESLPGPDTFDPLECLATATKMFQCEVELSGEPTNDDRYYRQAASASSETRTVDLTPAFCDGAPRCLPMIDGIVVWRDNSHFSMEIIQHRRERAWEVIKSTGVLEGI